MSQDHNSDSNPRDDQPSRRFLDDPIQIGGLCAFIALSILIIIPIGGRVRFGNSEYAWLDRFRIHSPFEIGWPCYILVSVLFCVCYGTLVVLLRWGLDRLLPWPLAKQTATWLFFVFVTLGALLFVPYCYRLPRMPWP